VDGGAGGSGTTGSGTAIITVASAATGITINNAEGAIAAASHNNMQPFIARRRAVYAGV